MGKMNQKWLEVIKEVSSLTKMSDWTPVKRVANKHSADAIIRGLRIRLPDFCFSNNGPMINIIKPKSQSLIEMAIEKDKEGRKIYKNDWKIPPSEELKQELADAYNYIQYAYEQGQIDMDQQKVLLADVLNLYHKVRLFVECPRLRGGPQPKNSVPKLFHPIKTIHSGEEDGTSE